MHCVAALDCSTGFSSTRVEMLFWDCGDLTSWKLNKTKGSLKNRSLTVQCWPNFPGVLLRVISKWSEYNVAPVRASKDELLCNQQTNTALASSCYVLICLWRTVRQLFTFLYLWSSRVSARYEWNRVYYISKSEVITITTAKMNKLKLELVTWPWPCPL